MNGAEESFFCITDPYGSKHQQQVTVLMDTKSSMSQWANMETAFFNNSAAADYCW
jgi:hypothetical protein